MLVFVVRVGTDIDVVRDVDDKEVIVLDEMEEEEVEEGDPEPAPELKKVPLKRISRLLLPTYTLKVPEGKIHD